MTRHFLKTVLLATGLCAAALPATAANSTNQILWDVNVGDYIVTCPAVGKDGTIYATVSGGINFGDTAGGKLVAVNPSGNELWKHAVTSDIKSSPAIGADGTIYFGCRDRQLHAVSSAGKELWSFATGAWVDSSPAIGADGAIYFGSWDQKFYAVNPGGKARWTFASGGPIDSSAAIGSDGTIYFGSHDHNFYALKPDGALKWKVATGGAIISSPAIDASGAIYFTSVDGRFYIVNPDGSKKTTFWTGGVRADSPVLDALGNIYICVNNLFCCYKPDGTRVWTWGYPIVNGSAALSADGAVYFAADTGNVYSFHLDGSDNTYYSLGPGMSGSLTINDAGVIYVGATRLYALQAKAGLAKGWSKFHGGLRQTGRMAE
jgi:outer membrane protein assembly factor BamB